MTTQTRWWEPAGGNLLDRLAAAAAEATAAEVTALVYLNHGRWVADCPRPLCGNAEMFGLDAKGAAGGLTGSFRCRTEEGGCGLTCRAVWPAEQRLIEEVTNRRPVPATRNWIPGETVTELRLENLKHGVDSVESVNPEEVKSWLGPHP